MNDKHDAEQRYEPFDRLTLLADSITAALDESGNEDVKCIVFLHDDERAGIKAHGYEDAADATADLFLHLKGMFNAQGKDLVFIPYGRETQN